MILRFDEFCNERETMDICPYDYLNETLTVSMDVKFAVDDVVKFIENRIEGDEIIFVEKKDILNCECDMFRFRYNPVCKIFGCDCEFILTFYNIIGDASNITDEQVNNFVLKNNFNAEMNTRSMVINEISHVNFVMRGQLILLNGKVSKFSKSTISHELRHGYISYKMYDGVREDDLKKNIKSTEKWRKTYNLAVKYIQNYKDNEVERRLTDKSFYNLMYAIYSCDISEVAAFAQEAYDTCIECKTKNEIINKMEDTNLHEMMYVFHNVLKLMNDDTVQNMYSKKKPDDFPTVHQFIKLVKKRYKKSKTSYGCIITLLCDELDERNEHILIDVK